MGLSSVTTVHPLPSGWAALSASRAFPLPPLPACVGPLLGPALLVLAANVPASASVGGGYLLLHPLPWVQITSCP